MSSFESITAAKIQLSDGPLSDVRASVWVRAAVLAGVLGPVLFTAVFLIDGFIHPAYNAVTDTVSELARGQLGWLQQVNFMVFGVNMIVFAAGIRWGVRRGPGSAAGAVIFAAIGLMTVLTGFFVTDPHTSPVHTLSGTIHQSLAPPTFGGFVATCLVFARRFHGALRIYAIASGILVVAQFVFGFFLLPIFFPSSALVSDIGIGQRISILMVCAWMTLLALALRAESRMEV